MIQNMHLMLDLLTFKCIYITIYIYTVDGNEHFDIHVGISMVLPESEVP